MAALAAVFLGLGYAACQLPPTSWFATGLAPLSGADVGVAVGARVNEVALGGADVALLSEDLNRLPEMMRLAERTRAAVVQNALLGTLFSVGMVALASAGVISALVGAVLHNAGAVFVVANSSRLLSGEDEDALTETA